MLFHELGPIRQFGYVVSDIRKAMVHWTEVLGVGPFFYLENAPVEQFRCRGEPTNARMSCAFANTGAVQIELVQPLDSEPSLFREFLDEGREGQQHVAYWTTELDSWIRKAEDAGVEILQSGYTGAPDGRFIYVDSGKLQGTIVEISEMRGRKRTFFETIAKASEQWDGREPVRVVSI